MPEMIAGTASNPQLPHQLIQSLPLSSDQGAEFQLIFDAPSYRLNHPFHFQDLR